MLEVEVFLMLMNQIKHGLVYSQKLTGHYVHISLNLNESRNSLLDVLVFENYKKVKIVI